MTKKIMMAAAVAVAAFAVNCTSMSNSLPTGAAVVNYNIGKADMNVSGATTGEASHTYILFINWARLFSSYAGSTGGVHVALPLDLGANCIGEATYNAIDKAGNADALLAPRSKTKVFNLGIFATADCSVTGKAATIK